MNDPSGRPEDAGPQPGIEFRFTPKIMRWPLRLSPEASLSEVIALFNALNPSFVGSQAEFDRQPEALKRWAGMASEAGRR